MFGPELVRCKVLRGGGGGRQGSGRLSGGGRGDEQEGRRRKRWKRGQAHPTFPFGVLLPTEPIVSPSTAPASWPASHINRKPGAYTRALFSSSSAVVWYRGCA